MTGQPRPGVDDDGTGSGWPFQVLHRLVDVRPAEVPALLWSFAYFFLLLSGYYILRPLRDEMGIAGGVKQLQWVFTGTFIAMLAAVPVFGAVAARLPRRRLLPIVYYFFIANILIFFALFKSDVSQVAVARTFFIWTSVFNLFVVSVFWSFMADLYSNAQARRLFGFIAGGGSAGAITGPALTALLAEPLGPTNLLFISATLFGGAVVCIHRLIAWSESGQRNGDGAPSAGRPDDGGRTGRPLGGDALAGVRLVLRSQYLLGIGLFIWLYTTLSTFLYFEQAHIIRAAFADPAARTTVFAVIDLAVNMTTLLLQAVLTGRLIAWFGLPATLALIPALMACGFLGLGLAPMLPVLVAFQVIRRAGNYGIARPAREVLFTVVGREAKYKAKNFIDTVIYRGGDAISGWLFTGLKTAGLGLSGIAMVAVPIAIFWMGVGLWLGKRQEALRETAPVALSAEQR